MGFYLFPPIDPGLKLGQLLRVFLLDFFAPVLNVFGADNEIAVHEANIRLFGQFQTAVRSKPSDLTYRGWKKEEATAVDLSRPLT
jgi:hypothetical protein